MVNQVRDAAIYYLEDLGCSVIPLEPSGKRPIGKWAEYQMRLASRAEVADWQADCNLGLVTGAISGIVVVDCESREDAEWFFQNRGRSPVISQTPRGYHLFFRHPSPTVRVPNAVRVECRYDIRGDAGYVVAPPSRVRNQPYCFLPGYGLRSRDDLPPFNPRWLPQTETTTPDSPGIRDAAAYIAKIHAIGGAGGHNATWRAVNRLRDAGLDELDAYQLLRAWNETNADPKWSEAELLHKIRSAYR